MASAANYTEIVFAKQATDVVFELMVTVEDPLADPSISDEARFTTWLSITVSNPSDRRLALHDGPKLLDPGQLGERGVRVGDGHEVEGRDDVGQAGVERQ